MKILITIGATREPIDSVRYITNFSTGETGAMIADIFSKKHHKVTALCGMGSVFPKNVSKLIVFSNFNDLNTKIKNELSSENYDLVIHSAAVSDYTPVNSIEHKLDSSQNLIIEFKKNFKILENIFSYSKNSALKIVAFKLTDTPLIDEQNQAIQKCFKSKGVEFVVHNDYSGVRLNQRTYSIHSCLGDVNHCNSREDLANNLTKICDSQTEMKEVFI